MSIADSDILPVSDGSLIRLFQDMTPTEQRTFWACASGYALDGLDFTVYPLLIGTLMSLWSVPAGQAGLAVTLSLLASAGGGWVAGFLSDRIGRVRTLVLTISWFTVASLLCAAAQNFSQLILFRTLVGVGFGGEWAAGAVLMGEAIRPVYRGRAVGCVQASYAIGWGGAVLGQALLFSLLRPDLAWRMMFLLGLVPCLILIPFIIRNVPEPPLSIAARSSAKLRGSMLAIFGPLYRRNTFLASLAFIGAHGGYYSINTWLPTFLKTARHLSAVGSTGYLGLQIAGSFAGYLVGAWLADRAGRRMVFLMFSVAAAGTTIVYTEFRLPGAAILWLGVPLGFFSSGYYSAMGPFLTELYPTHLRGSGQGFCYNVGRGLGALFPALIGFLSEGRTLAVVMTIFAVSAYGLFFLTALCLPETRGKVLKAD